METENVLIKNLLKPRYKVIADYPLSKMYFKVGDILTWNEKNQAYNINEHHDTYVSMAKETVESYPHLFQRLEWWEERSDLVGMYVRFGELESQHSYYQLTQPLENRYGFWFMKGRIDEHCYPLIGCYPATEQEYTSYINQSKTTKSIN